MKTKIYTLLLFASLFFFSGCDALLDCIASASPELSNNDLVEGNRAQLYNDKVVASVKNDPNDNDYNYFFTIDGHIPPGINYSIIGREIRFNGNPTTAGTYTIKVRVTIEPLYDYDDSGFNDSDRICLGNDATSRNYTFIIH